MEEINYKDMAKGLIETVKGLQLEQVRSWQEALNLIPVILTVVEQTGEKVVNCDKKKLAVALASELIDVPYVPASLEAVVFGAAIDVAINVLNQLFGKNWFARMAE